MKAVRTRFILEVGVEYPKDLHNLHRDLPPLSERMKIKKCNKLHQRALKQALNHGLILKKVHGVIQFNQEAWLQPYIEKNTILSIEAKNDFEKDFFKLMNDSVFGKTMGNVRKHRDIKLVATDKRRNQSVSEPDYHTTTSFSEDLLAIEMRKRKVKVNKPIHLGLSILNISKSLIYELWYNQKNIKTIKINIIQILTALLFILKLKVFIKILQMMLKKDMIHQLIKLIDHYRKK